MARKKLINTNDLIVRSEKKETIVKHQGNEIEHQFYISEGYKIFSKQLNQIEYNKTYHFVSFGQWSLKHVVFHIIKLIGACDIYSTTYGLGPNSAKGIVQALKSNLINSFHFLYDNKIKSYKIEAHDICASNFPVKIANIHAKVTVLTNDNFYISITGSANWSDSNDKIELTEIHSSKQLAYFHKNWITKAMSTDKVNPKEILNNISL